MTTIRDAEAETNIIAHCGTAKFMGYRNAHAPSASARGAIPSTPPRLGRASSRRDLEEVPSPPAAQAPM